MSHKADSTLRTVRVCPYALGKGPRFVLVTWDTYRTDGRGCSVLGYRLNMVTGTGRTADRVTLFEGEDFSGSPLHADDSDETLASLMTFLTLRPGDCDAEVFASDSPVQAAYRQEHAEVLAMEAERRFRGDGPRRVLSLRAEVHRYRPRSPGHLPEVSLAMTDLSSIQAELNSASWEAGIPGIGTVAVTRQSRTMTTLAALLLPLLYPLPAAVAPSRVHRPLGAILRNGMGPSCSLIYIRSSRILAGHRPSYPHSYACRRY